MWGSDSSNMYFVGDNGLIVHYNGSSWTKIESGTSLTLNDVWGGYNKWLGEDEVLIAAGEKYSLSDVKILAIQNNHLDSIPWEDQVRTRHSIWFTENGNLFSCGSGIFQYAHENWEQFTTFPTIYTNKIRGNDVNDIVVVGDYGVVAHYNGVSWKVYDEIALWSIGNYESVDIKGNIIIAVGWYNRPGCVAVGKRLK
jgi:hypothetical protein